MNTHYQKMKEKGYQCKKVWVLPENIEAIKDAEKLLRDSTYKVYYYVGSNKQGMSVERIR